MTSREEYLKAKRIVEEYENQEFIQGCLNAEYEDDVDGFELEERCECCDRSICVCEEVNNCKCGAWRIGSNGIYQGADCVCNY